MMPAPVAAPTTPCRSKKRSQQTVRQGGEGEEERPSAGVARQHWGMVQQADQQAGGQALQHRWRGREAGGGAYPTRPQQLARQLTAAAQHTHIWQPADWHPLPRPCPRPLTLYRPFTSSSLRSSPALPLALRGAAAAGLAPPPPAPPLLALPACIRTFIVSSGWMVLCEAARAMAPATTSCAGFWSGCGGGGGGAGGAAATAGAAIVAVPLVEAAAADTALPSLPVGCSVGGGRGGRGQLTRRLGAGAQQRSRQRMAGVAPAAHLAEARAHASAAQRSAQHEGHTSAGGRSDDALHARGAAAAGRAVTAAARAGRRAIQGSNPRRRGLLGPGRGALGRSAGAGRRRSAESCH